MSASTVRVKSGFSGINPRLAPRTFNICLCRGKSRDRDAERRAGDVVQADVVAELDGRRIAAVLTADTAVKFGTGLTSKLDRHLHQLADADGIQTREGIGFVDLVRIVRGQELAGIVTREAERHLRQVVGAEAEELRFLGNIVRRERRTRDLDHRADLILELDVCFLDDLVRRLDDDILDELHLLGFARQRDHDLGNDVPVGVLLLDADRSLDDRLGLHDGDLGIGNGQTAAAVTHHRVELVQVGDDLLDLRDRLLLRLRQSLDVLFRGGNELVQRRVEEADGYGVTAQSFVQFFEVGLLHRLNLRQSRFALFDGVGADHLAERRNTVGLEEHVLGAAKADALRAERGGLLRIRGGIRVGADSHRLVFVGQLHDAAEVAGRSIRSNRRDALAVDVAGGTVEGDDVALFIDFAREGELLVLLVHLDVAAAGDAAGTHAARNDRRVRSLSAAHRQNALRELHALDILGRGLEADKDDFLALLALFDGVLRRKDDGTCGRAGRRSDPLADDVLLVRFFQRLGVELRVKQHVEGLRVDLHQRFLLGDHALVDEVASDLDRGGSGALAVTRLEHVEFLVLDGELHVLHVAVVIFKDLADFLELLVNLGENARHLSDGHGRAHACNDVFALRVGQELAHKALFARGGIARERNARAAVVAHVAERHHLHVDRGTPAVGDVVVHTVDVRAGVVPRTEDRLDRLKELLLGIGREVLAELLFVLRLELVGEFLEVLRRQLDVLRDALLFLHLVDELFKVLLADFHDDVGEHLNESSVAVICPAGIAGLLCQRLHDFLIETEVEDRVHHAGHGSACTRTHGDEQRVLLVAELLAADLFHLVDVLHDLRLDRGIDLPSVLIVLRAGLRRDREALGDGKSDVRHLRKVGALAAEKLAHLRITFGKKVTILFSHEYHSS